jgi:hypothetical protein
MSPEQFATWMRFKSGPRAAAQGPPPPTSTQPYDAHQIVTLDRLARAWSKSRALKLGELIVEALALEHMTPASLLTLEDERLAEILERFVMFRANLDAEE